MKQIKYYIERKLNGKGVNFELILIALIPLTLLFKENFNSIAVLIFSFYWLYNKKYKEIDLSSKTNRWLILSSSIYIIVILIWTILSINFVEGLEWTSKKLFLIAIPLLLSYKEITKKEFIIINKAFILGILLMSFYCYIEVIIRALEVGGFSYAAPENENWSYFLFLNVRLSPDIHPVYFSLYCFYALISTCYILNQNYTKNRKAYYFIILYIVIFVILLGARSPIIFAIATGIVLWALQFLQKKKLKGFVGGIIVIFTLAILIFVLKDSVFKRTTVFFNQLNQDKLKVANIHNSQGKRMQLLLLSKEIISKQPVFGIGTANRKYYFIDYYNKNYNDKFKLVVKDHNAHNQYIESMIGQGLLGLLSLILMITVPILFTRNFFTLYSLFFILFALTLLTENLLDRQRGIIMFAFFATIIARHISTINETKYIKKT